MTLKELNNLRYIDGEIKILKEHIEELRAQAERITPSVATTEYIDEITGKKEICVVPNIGGTGHGHDRIADSVAAIIAEENKLEKLLTKRQQEKVCLMQYINGISDAHLRTIFFLRFIKGLSWNAVAIKMGGGNTSDGVRKKVMRYIDNF